MQLFSRFLGVGISALGAVLVLCGAFLPTYGSGDYEPAAFRTAPLVVIALLVAPALLVLVSSVVAWLRRLPIWLVVLCLLIIVPAVFLHVFASILAAGLACFDVCPPGGVHYGSGFWLPLVGFVVSAVGVIVVAATQRRRVLPGAPDDQPGVYEKKRRS